MADSKNIQSIVPLGGMDYDSDEKFIADGDYKYIVNGIKVGVGQDGIITNMPGNENSEDVASTFLVDNSGSYVVDDLDTITATEQDGNVPPSKIVGHCKDPKRNGILLFLKGVEGEGSQSVSDSIETYSSIYEFFVAGQMYVPILKNNQVIDVSGDVVYMEVIGDRLFWLEKGGSPKTINILKAYNYTHNKEGEAYSDITEYTISHIKRPPFFVDESLNSSVGSVIRWGRDSSINVSNVFDKIFQFRERYIYEDNLKSSWGNISVPSINPDLASDNTSTVQSGSENNYIDIRFDSGDETVEKIVVAAREGNIGEWFEIAVIDKSDPQGVYTNTGDSVTSDLSNDTYYYYRFFNRGGYGRTISDDEVNKIHENIPVESDVISSHYDGRIVFGGNVVDRKANITLDMSVSPNYYELSSSEFYEVDDGNEPDISGSVSDDTNIPTLINTGQVNDNDYTPYIEAVYDMSDVPDTIPAGTVISLAAEATIFVIFLPYDEEMYTGPTEREFTVLNTVSKDYLFNNLNLYVSNNYDSVIYDTSTDIVKVRQYYGNTYYSSIASINFISDSKVYDGYVSVASNEFYPSAKRGRHRCYPIQYIDEYGRRSEPLFMNDNEVYIKDKPDSGYLGQVLLEVSLNHTPPTWAKYYQFLKNSTRDTFIKTNILGARPYYDEDGSNDGTIALQIAQPSDVIDDIVEQHIDNIQNNIDAIVDRQKQSQDKDEKEDLEKKRQDVERNLELQKYDLVSQYKRALSSLRQYEFSKGDRLRIIKDGGTYDGENPIYKDINYRINPVDVQIVDVVEETRKSDGTDPRGGIWVKILPTNAEVESAEGELYDFAQSESSGDYFKNALVEIYKPSYTEKTNLFYEFGTFYKIDNGNHSQTNLFINPYECYLRSRILYSGTTPLTARGDAINVVLEDSQVTHDFKSDIYDNGRINVVTEIDRGIKHPSVIYTRKQFEGTALNGLAEANYDGQVYLSEAYGDIQNIFLSGNTLKVIQDKKITSFYPQGSEILARKRQSQTDYGSVYPRSMVMSPSGYIYGYDVYNGIIWRDTNNGVYNITGRSIIRGNQLHYKIGYYLKQLSKEVRDNGISKGSDDVIAAYDEYNDLVYFSFLQENLDSDVVPYRTLLFHEPSNRWVGFLDISPTGYGYGYETLLSSNITDGNIYTHNREEDIDGNANYNVFYEDQKTFEAVFVSNIMPNVRKVFDAMHIHATTNFSVPEITVPKDSTIGNEKFSKLNTNHFILQDGVYKSEILNNMKTTNTTKRDNELLTGDRMRGYTLKFKLQSTDSDKFELFKVDIFTDPYIS